MLLAAAVLAIAPLPAAAQELEGVPVTLDASAARPALDRALGWLVATQSEDGSWAHGVLDRLLDAGYSVETYAAYRGAAQALACLALLRAPESPPRRAALERGLDWLASAREPRRGSDWDNDAVWSGLYGLVLCTETARDPRFADGPRAADLAAAGRRFGALLARNQTPAGGWGYYDDPIYSRRPKWDTSFCTALVLPALLDARELGWIEDERVTERALRYVQRCALPNGAYAYDLRPVPRYDGGESIDAVKGSLGRIQVGNWARARAGDPRVTPERIRAGLTAFFDEHRFLDVAWMRPIPHEAYYANAGYFYLFGHYYAAEAIELLPAEEREGWHARLRPHLVKVQRADGSTSDFLTSGYMLLAGTSFLALALERGLPTEAPAVENDR